MLLRREAVRALAGVEGRLLHPVPDRLGRGLKLAPELLGRSAMPDQLDHLPPERRRVRPMALRHRGRSLPPQPWGVHETGSTPLTITIGIVLVAFLAPKAAWVTDTTSTSGLSWTSSAASRGNSSGCPRSAASV